MDISPTTPDGETPEEQFVSAHAHIEIPKVLSFNTITPEHRLNTIEALMSNPFFSDLIQALINAGYKYFITPATSPCDEDFFPHAEKALQVRIVPKTIH